IILNLKKEKLQITTTYLRIFTNNHHVFQFLQITPIISRILPNHHRTLKPILAFTISESLMKNLRKIPILPPLTYSHHHYPNLTYSSYSNTIVQFPPNQSVHVN
ncbi:hypothetical protein KSS87_023288, partial [Heliosperma pusillum]